jgi:hypothetical protein
MGITVDDNSHANVFYVPFTTTIDKIGFYVASTTTAGDLVARIETVTTPGLLPSNSLYHADATGTKSLLTSDDAVWAEVTLTNPVTVTAGDLIALVVKRVSGTFTGNLRRVGTQWASDLPVASTRASTASAWVNVANRVMAIGMNSTTDGWVEIPDAPMFEDTSTINVSSVTAPDEIGTRFVLPFTTRLVSMAMSTASITAADAVTWKLYDASNNVLWSQSFTYNTNISSGAGIVTIPVTTRPILRKGQVYRATVTPTVGTLNYSFTLMSSTYRALAGQDGSIMWTERTDAGAWTDNASRLAAMSFKFDQIGANIPAHGLIG